MAQMQEEKSSWDSGQLDDLVQSAAGNALHLMSMPPDTGRGYDFKRRGSIWMCRNLEQLLAECGISGTGEKANIGLVNCLAYSYFSNDENVNLFQFKTSVEHQTPAAIGGQLGFTGPQFIVKEGDNADLAALAMVAESYDCFPGPMIIAGTSEPHRLLAGMELINEQRRLSMARNGEELASLSETRFSEGAAALFLESEESARARGCTPKLSLAATYGSMSRLNYADPAALQTTVATLLNRLVMECETPPKLVFGCFRNNRLIVEAEKAALRELAPEAIIVNSAERLGNCSVISGLVDIAWAAALAGQDPAAPVSRVIDARSGTKQPIQLFSGDNIIVYKISSLGNFSGAVLRVK